MERKGLFRINNFKTFTYCMNTLFHFVIIYINSFIKAIFLIFLFEVSYIENFLITKGKLDDINEWHDASLLILELLKININVEG